MNILFSKIEYSKLINCLGGMCKTSQGITIYGMFGIQNFEIWNWNLYVKCLEFENLKTKMSRLGCVKNLKIEIENWNIYLKHLKFENLKIEMFEFGCENIEIWNLKTKIWNFFVRCLEGI
jgi:hypothetical protein